MMRLVIAPAKRFHPPEQVYAEVTRPLLVDETQRLLTVMKEKTAEQLQSMLGCSRTLAKQAWQQYQHMDLQARGSAALLTYDGIQYATMAPHVLSDEEMAYLNEHLRIISGFYGILRPSDGIVPHRLEMDTPFHTSFCRSLNDFWGSKVAEVLGEQASVIVDLASAQHSRILKTHLRRCPLIKCWFKEETATGLREKGVYVKIARGEMVRFAAAIQAQSPQQLKQFSVRGYRFRADLSDPYNYVFSRKEEQR